MIVAELVGRALAQLGVGHAFGVVGSVDRNPYAPGTM